LTGRRVGRVRPRPKPRPCGAAGSCTPWGLPSRPGHPARWCALTAPFHPLPTTCKQGVDPARQSVNPANRVLAGLLSVAHAVTGDPAGPRRRSLPVRKHGALWCSDFPHRRGRISSRDARPDGAMIRSARWGRRSAFQQPAARLKRACPFHSYLPTCTKHLVQNTSSPPPASASLARAYLKEAVYKSSCSFISSMVSL